MSTINLETDLTKGNVVKQLIKFAVPFIISNFIQSLYSVADMVIVGNFAGSESMNGVTQGSQITTLVTNAVIGLSVGGVVLIGQYLGAGRRKDLKDTISTLLTSLIALSVILTVAMLIFRTPVMKLINVPSGVIFDEALNYFTITSVGTFFIFGYNALSAIMRGMGDSKTPLIFVGVACIANVGFDLLMVGPMGMKASGAALATVISQALSMILCILYLKKNKFIFDFKLSSFGFNRHKMGLLLKIGFPTMINNISVGLSFVFILSIVNTVSAIAGSAVGAVGRINSFAILPVAAVSSAISAMAAQNIGAGKNDRAVKTMTAGMIISFSISSVIFIITQMFPEFLLGLFLEHSDPQYIQYIKDGTAYIQTFSFDYLLVPVQFCLNGLYIGAGKTNFSLINGILSSLLIRIPASYIFGITMGIGITGIGIGAPAATVFAGTIGIIYYFSGRWKKSINI